MNSCSATWPGWWQGRILGNEEYKVMGGGLCEYAAGEGGEHMGRIFCLGGSIMRKLGSVCEACVLEKILKLMLRRAAREACRAAWILGTKWQLTICPSLRT